MDKISGYYQKELKVGEQTFTYYDITSLQELGINDTSRLPYSYKILLENAIRNYDEHLVTLEHVKRIGLWPEYRQNGEIPFIPSRIILQDFTGVPVIVDLAAMRTKIGELGGDPSLVNPRVPVDLVIDHSVIVDSFGDKGSIEYNVDKEFERNYERYELLKWAQRSFSNMRVFPPSLGIVHQINLEYLATVASTKTIGDHKLVFPDTLVGTDSHTTMINGIGVLGWGVGGIEAEAGMLGQPLYFLVPEVVGLKLTGSMPHNVVATDLALTVTNLLRKEGVVGKFVEFYGDGVSSISVEDRATVANMSPEYGATIGFFPVDDKTLDYLRATGRSDEQIELVEKYYKVQGMFRTDNSPEPVFTKKLELDLSTLRPSLAGPKRPQDHVKLLDMKKSFFNTVTLSNSENEKAENELSKNVNEASASIQYGDGYTEEIKTGAVVIASITSCTNTSNPEVMMGAGILAKKAVEKGLRRHRYVKTSLAPGSLVVTDYLQASGLLPYLEELGFSVVGYGCATCIGNSGPLIPEVGKAVKDYDMTVAAVLSGNRNFEGRIHPQTKLNYLASPILVVAYALAGTVNIDFESEPIGYDVSNNPVFLKDIWPGQEEIKDMIKTYISPDIYRLKYKNILYSNLRWNKLPVNDEAKYKWTEESTYIKRPPFFDAMEEAPEKTKDITDARVLAILGDSITTDHISPAGSIPESSPAGYHLSAQNVKPEHFNSYGSRRGTHEVMMRGTFANIRIRNKMIPGVEGGFTRHIPSAEIMPIYDACMKYKEKNTPLVVLAGKEYGTGSSRDWAAKGTYLLGVRAVIAESFERIHRSNLVGMGVLPLQFMDGENAETLGLTGYEEISISGIAEGLEPNKVITVTVTSKDGQRSYFQATARLDSSVEIEYYRHGGILQMILRDFLKQN